MVGLESMNSRWGDPIFFNFIVQGAPADPQSPSSLFFVPTTIVQYLLEQFFFGFRHRRFCRMSRLESLEFSY